MQATTSRPRRGNTERQPAQRTRSERQPAHTCEGLRSLAGRFVPELGQVRFKVPMVGHVKLPSTRDVAFYTTVGALAVVGLLEWPVAAVVVAGHLLSTAHSHSLAEVGEALEEA